MNPVRILHLESPNLDGQGDHVYRTLQPCRALGTLPGISVLSGSLLSAEVHPLLETADLLVLCDVVDVDLIRVVEQRRARGLPTVYEINDHFRAPQTWNRTAYLADNLLTRSLSAQLAARADLVQFTCPALAEIFGGINPRHAVFGNHLWSLPAARDSRDTDIVWLGWGGSLGHLADLEWVMPVLRGLLARHPHVRLAIMGPQNLGALFDWVPPERFRFRKGGNIAEYYAFVDTLDIGICPLLPTPFNRCRTDIKLLELSAHGVVPVCSDLDPYRAVVRPGENGFLFTDLPELENILERLVCEAALRQRVTAAARLLAQDRLEEKHVEDRAACYRELLARAPNGSADPLWQTARSGPYHGSRYRRLTGKVERHLYQGLTLSQEGDIGAARRELRAAQKLAPRFYLPHLIEGTTEPDPTRALAACRRAVQLNPHSAAAALAAAGRWLDAGDIAAAREELLRALALSPNLGAAQARLADLCERQGDTRGATEWLTQAFAANPYFLHPPLRLALAALETKDATRATTLAAAAAARDPDHHLPHFLLGRAALLQDDPQGAIGHLERALDGAPDPTPILAQLAKAHAQRGDLATARALLEKLRAA